MMGSRHSFMTSAGIVLLSLLPCVTKALSASAAPPRVNEIFDLMRAQHQDELTQGFAVFGTRDEVIGENHDNGDATMKFSDADFTRHSVGIANAGPDEASFPKNGHCVFQTAAPVLTPDECQALIDEARHVIHEGLRDDNDNRRSNDKTQQQQQQPTNSQLGEARVSQLPMARQWLRQVLHQRLFPLLENRFGIAAVDLTLQDSLIIGYGFFGNGAQSQPVHRDSSLLSLNVALSPRADYSNDGGGTYFQGLDPADCILTSQQGQVICHASGASHAGRGITAGERWVLVLFVIARDYPELARRCHAQGINLSNDEEKRAVFQAGLSLAPRDHLLLTSLGGVATAQGDSAKARGYLARAAVAYPHCTQANMALGKMFLLSLKRPRAALRRFDAVLDWMQDRDLVPNNDLTSFGWPPLRAVGFDARVLGAQAALLCARHAKEKGAGKFDWKAHTERAQARCHIALQASPNDTRIQSMIQFADKLLKEDDYLLSQ